MTLYVLHGGLTTEVTRSNTDFYKLMADHVPENGIWLGCYFSRLNEFADAKFDEDRVRMEAVADKPIRIDMAKAATFEAQVKAADVIYFAGGSTRGLMNQIVQWPELGDWLQTKAMVAGSSAGMNMLARGYISKDGAKGSGLGLVPFNVLVHHTAPEYAPVQQGKPLPAPLLAVHETQFCVLEL